MTQLNQIYKCELCGNIVQVVHEASGELVCCRQAMTLLCENTQEAALEKHLPVFTQTDQVVKVKIGEIPHPMTSDHFIEWIEILTEQEIYRHKLNPQDLPEVEFTVNQKVLAVRAYCNLHGLWKEDGKF
jgi:superoxide reductase